MRPPWDGVTAAVRVPATGSRPTPVLSHRKGTATVGALLLLEDEAWHFKGLFALAPIRDWHERKDYLGLDRKFP
jgi:hypothetical protein